MAIKVTIQSPRLTGVLKDVDLSAGLRKKLGEALGRSAGRVDVAIRGKGSDFGSLVNQRSRKRGGNPNDPAPGEYTVPGEVGWPVETGRSAQGWKMKIKGTSAILSNNIDYSPHVHVSGERAGQPAKRMDAFIRKDWEKVAEEMADLIEDALNG